MPGNICKNCGVGLEHGMKSCPLCKEIVNDNSSEQLSNTKKQELFQSRQIMEQKQRKFLWEIISISLLSGSIATGVLDLSINKMITWSQYPVAISLIVFTYVSIFAFWKKSIYIQMGISLILSALAVTILDAPDGTINWSTGIAIPLLLTLNLLVAAMVTIIRLSKHKGINLIAYGFLGVALQCLCIEGILSFYNTGVIKLHWSVIVSACIVPVIIVLLFLQFRLKRGKNLERTFHI